jgi:YegS/Rv2252/BmrU family lipid kinase
MSWFAVVNPTAGSIGEMLPRVRAALARRSLDAQIEVSLSAEHLAELVDGAADAGYRRFVAVGGDGTASLTVDALLRRDWAEPPTLGILPAGSGSDFVRTFGFPQRLEDAAVHLTGDTTYPVDVLAVEGSWGVRRAINAVDAGVLGATVKRAERLTRRLGRIRYQAAFWLTLPGFRPGHVVLTMGDRRWEGTAVTVVMANGQFFGGGVNIAPRATLIDGLLDVQVFACSRLRALMLHPKAIRGLHLRDPAVQRFEASEVVLETERPYPVEVDGDYLGETPLRVTVERAAINMKI